MTGYVLFLAALLACLIVADIAAAIQSHADQKDAR